MANVTGSFAATGQSAAFAPRVASRDANSGQFNIALTGGGTATIQLEKSFDNGATWCAIYGGGTQLYIWSYTGTNLSETVAEIEAGVLYRLNCTSYTSGVTYRLSGPQ